MNPVSHRKRTEPVQFSAEAATPRTPAQGRLSALLRLSGLGRRERCLARVEGSATCVPALRVLTEDGADKPPTETNQQDRKAPGHKGCLGIVLGSRCVADIGGVIRNRDLVATDAARIDSFHPRRNRPVCISVRDDKVAEVLASIGSSTGPASTGVDLCDGPWVVGIGPHNASDFAHIDAKRNERDGEDESGKSAGRISGRGRALCLHHRPTLSPLATEIDPSACASLSIGSIPDLRDG